jgi:hypothetical protein
MSYLTYLKSLLNEENVLDHINYWYDKNTRSWVIQRKDKSGNQIETAEYQYNKPNRDKLSKEYNLSSNKIIKESVGDLLVPMSDKEYESTVSPQAYKIGTMVREIRNYLDDKGYEYGNYGPYPERYKKGNVSFRIYNQTELMSMDMLYHHTGKRIEIVPYTNKVTITDQGIKLFKDKAISAIDDNDAQNEVDVRVKNESVGDLLVPMS